MALAANNHYEIRADATANNVNGGGFNPANANFMTDLTTDTSTGNTATPVVSSASYNFVAGDIGAYVFIKSGTNWIPGWYVITSVASNKATVDAAIGHATLYADRTLSTVVGVATVATPTSGTFSVDYSHKTAAITTNTDGSGAGTTTFTGSGFTKAMIGNLLHITAGTGATQGWYEIVNFTNSTTLTIDRNPGTGSSWTYYVGGAMSMNSTLDDDFFDILLAGNTIWVNASGGTVSLGEAVDPANSSGTQTTMTLWGFATYRGDNPLTSNRPLINCGANTFTLSSGGLARNLIITSTSTSSMGNSGGTSRLYMFCKFINTSTTSGRNASQNNVNTIWIGCEAISYFGSGFFMNGQTRLEACWAHGCKDRAINASSTGGNSIVVINSIVSDFVTMGIETPSNFNGPHQIIIQGCTIFGALNTRGTGINMQDANVRFLSSCIISGCATGVSSTLAVGTNQLWDDYNDYYNNDSDVSNWTKGTHDIAVNPDFTNVGQVTGTAGKFDAGGSKLIDTSKNFSALGVVVGDLVYIASGTGLTNAMFFGITSISTTTNTNDTLNLDVSPGTNTTADKVYEIETGHDFLPTNFEVLTGGYPQGIPES